MHKALLTLTLVLVFTTSAFVSVSGLAAVFSSAGIVIILMGCGMELGKILTVIHLHRKWTVLNWLSRGFYITVIVALVLITSCEIMGYLSQNHVKGFLSLKSNHASLDALEKEEIILRDRIKTIDKTLSGLPVSYVTKRLRERENAGYEDLQVRLTEVINEKADIERQQITDKAYSAPIFATARIFNIDETRAASFFIFFLVCVLEPLSIGLAVAVSRTWLPQYSRELTTLKNGFVDKPMKTHIKPEAEIQISDNPVVSSIKRLINANGGFKGTMTELLEVLNKTDDFAGKNGWPEDAHDLGKLVKALEPQLSELGIYVKRSRTMERRTVEIGRQYDST